MKSAIQGLRILWSGVVLALLVTVGSSGLAVTLTTAANETQWSSSSPLARWSFEGDLQAHSVAGPASPWFGIATAYEIFDSMNFGIRGFVPLAHTVDSATYALQTFFRYRVLRGMNTDFFIEPEYSENFYNFVPFGSGGLSVGVLDHIQHGLAIGVMGGLEAASVVIDSIGLENENSLVVYPKIGLLADFNF